MDDKNNPTSSDQNQGGMGGGGMPPVGDQPVPAPAAPTDQPAPQPTPAPTAETPVVQNEQPGMGGDTGTGQTDTSGGENPTGGAPAM